MARENPTVGKLYPPTPALVRRPRGLWTSALCPTTAGSASRMSLRLLLKVSARQSPNSAIVLSIRTGAESSSDSVMSSLRRNLRPACLRLCGTTRSPGMREAEAVSPASSWARRRRPNRARSRRSVALAGGSSPVGGEPCRRYQPTASGTSRGERYPACTPPGYPAIGALCRACVTAGATTTDTGNDPAPRCGASRADASRGRRLALRTAGCRPVGSCEWGTCRAGP